jgi:hypothetical protein
VSAVDCGNCLYDTASNPGNLALPKKGRSVHCLPVRFRRRQKKMARPAAATAKILAITPPAMAPVLGGFPPGVGVGSAVAVGVVMETPEGVISAPGTDSGVSEEMCGRLRGGRRNKKPTANYRRLGGIPMVLELGRSISTCLRRETGNKP